METAFHMLYTTLCVAVLGTSDIEAHEPETNREITAGGFPRLLVWNSRCRAVIRGISGQSAWQARIGRGDRHDRIGRQTDMIAPSTTDLTIETGFDVWTRRERVSESSKKRCW